MSKKPPPISLFTVIPWSMAAVGLITAVGNLLGLAEVALPAIPRVENIPGVFASSLFLLGLGFLAVLVQQVIHPRS